MRHIWMAVLMAAMVVVVIWQQAVVAKMDEELRTLRDEQDRIDLLLENIPDVIRASVDRLEQSIIAYWKGRGNGREAD